MPEMPPSEYNSKIYTENKLDAKPEIVPPPLPPKKPKRTYLYSPPEPTNIIDKIVAK